MRNVMNKNKTWWEEDGRKTCKKAKHKKCFVSREIHFKNREEFFLRKVFFNDETYKTGVLFAKMLVLKGRE